jgi:proteasome lid subunit RPN8/RPN11
MIALTEKQITDLKEHAAETYPKECCGILLGNRDTDKKVVKKIIRGQNSSEEPHDHFTLDSEAIIEAERGADECDLEILGFYHSHPDCSTCISREDCRYVMPGMSYPVISVIDNSVSSIASWEQRVPGDKEEIEQEAIILAASS